MTRKRKDVKDFKMRIIFTKMSFLSLCKIKLQLRGIRRQREKRESCEKGRLRLRRNGLFQYFVIPMT